MPGYPARPQPTQRNPHRSGQAWTLTTVVAILANPRYTGRQVWNRQRTDHDPIDPGNTMLGHRQVQRWNLPAGWVISRHQAHFALVNEADYIAAQEISAPRGPAGPAARQYLLAGLIRCGTSGRRLESTWSNGRPAYRCRHGYTSAALPGSDRLSNAYIREDKITTHLAAAILPGAPEHTRDHQPGQARGLSTAAQAADLIGQLRAAGCVLVYEQQKRSLRTSIEGSEVGGASRTHKRGVTGN